MKYKALMLDVDGTILPYDYQAIPSEKVISAVKKAQERITVCIVTGRSYPFTEKIFQSLGMHSGYAVVNNGANVIDLKTKQLIYDQPISLSDAKEIIKILNEEKISFYLKQNIFSFAYYNGHFTDISQLERPYMFFTDEDYSYEKLEEVSKKLSHLTDLNIFKGHHKDPDKFNLNITHVNATKLHGLNSVIETLKINKDEVIAVGDGYNDFPLLMASGLKVAMGNAIEDLKAIADYVAPSVTDDGVADVIEKFIINSKE